MYVLRMDETPPRPIALELCRQATAYLSAFSSRACSSAVHTEEFATEPPELAGFLPDCAAGEGAGVRRAALAEEEEEEEDEEETDADDGSFF